LEFDFSRGVFDIKGTDAERRLTGYSIDFIQKFFPYDLMKRVMMSPYALVGGGELDDRTLAPGYDFRTYHTSSPRPVSVSCGPREPEGPTRVQLRTEAKYRMEFASPETFGVRDPSA